MSTEADRRAQGASRIPFEALVEVGGATGPSFEAQAVNISEIGMQLRTAYLPELGQPITCRFDAGEGQSVLASGEVVWTQNGGKGGEFGIRFTDMDPDSIESLRRMCGVGPDAPPAAPGAKVRLHIEGLASPMRARVRDGEKGGLTVGSDLGFLQVGKELDLEDAASGTKRPARIDRVEIEVDASSRVPQLVVSLRYADAAGQAEAAADQSGAAGEIRVDEAPPVHAERAGEEDLDAAKRMPHDVKGALTRGVSKIAPAFATFTKRAKTTIALLAAKSGAAGEPAARRTTAKAPGGGLHTSGRRVIRGETMNTSEEATMPPKFKITKRKVAIGGAALLAIILAVIAFKKPHAPPSASASGAEAPALAATMDAHRAPPPSPPAALAAPAPQPTAPAMASPMAAAAMDDTMPSGAADKADKKHKGKPGKVTPFGNGAVSHGNLLHLKMDGPIETIQGAQQPTGFTVHVPGRKAAENAGPLAARDSRIGTIKVSNDPNGAELTITFKDGVPNYQVRAKGDTLEIALAQPGKGATAKKDAAGAHGKHPGAKKHHDKGSGEKHEH